ncbi:MAG: hypothetical protein ACHP79_04975, partial [Terriglobales bacterium]
NGALMLKLLRKNKTWEQLCSRYDGADPKQLKMNTATMDILKKLHEMRSVGLVNFQEEETPDGPKPKGDIHETNLWTRIRVAFGGMSLSEVAMISRHSKGLATVPVFGRPAKPTEKIDVFTLMPFNTKIEKVYTNHIKKLGEELGLAIRRADEIFSPRPFMEKVWEGICASQLVLADCTERNPNVFYEIGIAHTVGKKVVLITRSDDDIPSDIKHFDYIPYIYDPEGVDALIARLRAFLKSQFQVNVASSTGV